MSDFSAFCPICRHPHHKDCKSIVADYVFIKFKCGCDECWCDGCKALMNVKKPDVSEVEL